MNYLILICGIITIIIDQITKCLVTIYLPLNIKNPLIDNFLYLTYTNNNGAAWSILNNQTILIIIITFIILYIIYSFMFQFKNNKRNNIAFGLLIGGILGNLIDRIIHGYVIDFIDVYILSYDFPIFNIADCSIVIGVILLLIAIIRKEDQYVKNNSKRK